MTPDPAWWRQATVYQIHPCNFADSNGDGIGDMRGITSHMQTSDSHQSPGEATVWLCCRRNPAPESER